MNFGLLSLSVKNDFNIISHSVNSLNNTHYSKKLSVHTYDKRALLEAMKQRIASLVHIHVMSGVSASHYHS